MKAKSLITIFTCGALLLSACQDENDGPGINTDRTALEVSAGIVTRATDQTWHKGDAIGIYTLKAGTATAIDSNFKYINGSDDGASAGFSPADEANTAYYPTDGSEVDVLAYYPHQLTIDNGQLTMNVTDQTSLPAIDLMTADKVTGKSQDDPEVTFAFTHRLTKVNVTLNADPSLGDINLAEAKVTIAGTPGTAVYELNAQELKSFGPAANIELKGDKAIVIPTPAGSGVVFSIEAGGHTFTAPLPETVALGTGEEATITITLKETPNIPAAVTAMIKPWVGGPTAGLTAINIDIPQNDMQIDAAITNFSLWKTANEADKRVYTLSSSEWSASPAPFYTTDVVVGDAFNATTTLGAADAITGLSDDLEANATITEAGVLSFEFGHANAQLTVNISKGEGFPEGDDISTATFKILEYDLTGAANTLIVKPATIAAGTDIAVTVNSRTYLAKVSEAIELNAGTINTLNIALKLEQGKAAASLKVTVKDWAVGATADLTAINVVIPPNPSTGTPEITTFTLWKNKGKEGAASAEYNYNNNEWNVTGTPFYVEDTAADDEFTAIHTPIDAPALGVKDVLETPATKMKDGEIALEFAHVNARLTVNLYRDTENNQADLSTAAFKLLGYDLSGAQNTLVVTPQTIAAGTTIEVTASGTTYKVTTASAINLAAGTHNNLNITLKYEKTELGLQVTTKDWDTVNDVELTAVNIVVPNDPGTGTPALTEFMLTKFSGDEETAVIYTYANNKWTTNDAPYYIEDIKADDEFSALYIPEEADPISGISDLLITGTVKMQNGVLALEFWHFFAKVTVKLAKGAGFPVAVDLSTAEVDFGEFSFTGEVNTFLHSPKAFAAGNEIATVTVGGYTYTVKAKKDITLDFNSQTVLTFTLTPAEVGIGVSLADWDEEVEKYVDAKLDIAGDIDFRNIKKKGVFEITAGSSTGTYQWDGSAITSSDPIYWDDLSEGKHNFALTFTPDISADAGSPEQDILKGTAMDVDWGSDINFNLTHANAQFTVKLAKGTGYKDAAEFATAAATAKITLIGFSTEEYEMNNEEAAIVAPQSISIDTEQKVQLKINGHTYTLLMSNVTGLNELEADKKYTLTATVNKTGVSAISIGNISDWGEGGSGTGEFEY